jgi:MerR family transcriptional regulator, light-induced transcriptional regulator
MLDKVSSTHTISDLHHLTGVSMHTIRIWERRFDLLKPQRTESNIRLYNNSHLRKLLNISLLLNSGYKISELAAMNDVQIVSLVNDIQARNAIEQHSIDQFKVAMLEFNASLFHDTYAKLIGDMSFYDLFRKVMIPFLQQIGQLWQTESITVAHEHFISNLIRQKLFANIDKMPRPATDKSKVHLLFLPSGELHELGLLFLHYVLLLHGKNSVYLGPDVNIDVLEEMTTGDNTVFITYFTVVPAENQVKNYMTSVRKKLLKGRRQVWVTGSRIKSLKMPKYANVHLFPDVRDLIRLIEK